MFHHLQRCSPSSQGPRDLHGLHGRGLSSRWKLRKQPDSRVCSEPVVGAQTRGIPRNSSVKVNSFEGLSHKFMETHGWQAVFIWQMKDFACATEKIDRQVLVWINLDETFACSLECLRGCVLVTSSGKLTQRIRIFLVRKDRRNRSHILVIRRLKQCCHTLSARPGCQSLALKAQERGTAVGSPRQTCWPIGSEFSWL